LYIKTVLFPDNSHLVQGYHPSQQQYNYFTDKGIRLSIIMVLCMEWQS